jgi:hypothetical protein
MVDLLILTASLVALLFAWRSLSKHVEERSEQERADEQVRDAW